MNNPLIRRPKTVQEVAKESPTYSEFGMNLKDFLHEFARAKQAGVPLLPMFKDEPERLVSRFKEGKICDAFLAGMADHLCRINGILSPEWAFSQDRALDVPWFSDELPAIRMLLLRDTPSAFKDKNIFVFESALNVA